MSPLRSVVYHGGPKAGREERVPFDVVSIPVHSATGALIGCYSLRYDWQADPKIDEQHRYVYGYTKAYARIKS